MPYFYVEEEVFVLFIKKNKKEKETQGNPAGFDSYLMGM